MNIVNIIRSVIMWRVVGGFVMSLIALGMWACEDTFLKKNPSAQSAVVSQHSNSVLPPIFDEWDVEAQDDVLRKISLDEVGDAMKRNNKMLEILEGLNYEGRDAFINFVIDESMINLDYVITTPEKREIFVELLKTRNVKQRNLAFDTFVGRAIDKVIKEHIVPHDAPQSIEDMNTNTQNRKTNI